MPSLSSAQYPGSAGELSAGTFDVTKIAECIPYEDNSTIDYSDTDWSTDEFEWKQDEDCGRPNIEKKNNLEMPF